MSNLYVTALEQIQGSLRAADDDCQDEEGTLRDGGDIDDGMLDGALFHAKEGVARLEKLIAAVRSTSEAETQTSDVTTRPVIAPDVTPRTFPLSDDLHALLADVLHGLNAVPNASFIDCNGQRTNTYALAARIERTRKG